jgi:aryl-alcohol dehydrogenase-like predicted oxidoreductase
MEREFSDLCLTEGLGIVPWSPLGGGFLTGKYQREKKPESPSEGRIAIMSEETEEAWHRRATEKNWRVLEVMDDIASNYNLTHPQIALAWLLEQPAVSSVIMGVRTMEQLEDNLNAAQVELPPEEMERLNEISAPELGYPYRFIQSYGAREAG